MKDELIIVNHIGTSVIEAIEDELMALVKDIHLFTKKDTLLSFNSNRAISKLKSKGIIIPTLEEVLKSAIGKYEHVLIITMHLVGGTDYDQVLELVNVYKGQISIDIICPLLKDQVAFYSLVEYMQQLQENEDRALLIVVHGTSHGSNDLYFELFNVLKRKLDNIYLVSLLDDIGVQMCELPEKIFIFPFFTVTGHHVQKDIFDSDESIYKSLKQAGKDVSFWRKGLLQNPEIKSIYMTLIKKSLGR